MGITVTGKLNKDATTFAAGDSAGFGVRIGVQAYNRKTKEKEWTNYEAPVFAKGAQVDFYSSSLVAGAIVSISGSGLLVKSYDGQNGTVISLEIQDAKIEFVAQGAERQQAPAQQQRPAQRQQPQNQPPAGFDNFFDDSDPGF